MQNDDATRGGAVVFNDDDMVPLTHDSFSAAPEPQQSPKPRSKQHAQTRPADGVDNTNRKLLNLPPVVGSCLRYANKSLPYRPFPADVDDVRRKVFLIEKPLLLDSQQIADYWPHVSNFYMRSSKPTSHDNGTVSEAWECRIRRRVTRKGQEKSGLGIRQRQSKDELLGDVNECKVRLKVLSYTKHATSQEACGGPGFGNCHCVAEWLYIEQTNNAEGNMHHTHPLDLLDVYKRSDAIMYFCKLKVEEGQYSYAAVVNWARENYGHITTQLQHITKADVANVARIWRQRNKDLELRSEIVEETDEDRQRKECLDSIQTTSIEQLRKALTEVCKTYPHAVYIIAPFMEKQSNEQDQAKPIAEGYELNIPPPGRPQKRKKACDPPSPQTSMQAPQVPSPYSSGYTHVSQAPQNTAVRGSQGFPPSLSPYSSSPAPNATFQATAHGLLSSGARPRAPYSVAPPPHAQAPVQFVHYPRSSAAQSSAARTVTETSGSQHIAINGTASSQNRPSWAQQSPLRRWTGGQR